MWDPEKPAAKIPGTQRTEPLERTEQRAARVLHRIPVTRICDLTPLDHLALPVFSAVTPLAEDLTTHMGKGQTPAAARVSAIMEAVERVSAERVCAGSIRHGSIRELRRDPSTLVIDPVDFVLPSDTAYRDTERFSWVESFELVTARRVLVATDLVVNPPRDGVLRDVDTNGLASGNTMLEAVVHGICEVIERDAWSQFEFVTEFAPEETDPELLCLDLTDVPPSSRSWVDRIRDNGLRVVVHDITNDMGVPTFRALLSDPSFPSPSGPRTLHFYGLGTHPSAEVALSRAITEAVQGRLSVIQGARDSYNTTPGSARRSARERRRAQLVDAPNRSFDEVPTFEHDDVRDDLRLLLDRVTAAGLDRVIATDLTRPDLGIPVVRVRIPGLSAFGVNRRRVDWRCLRHLL